MARRPKRQYTLAERQALVAEVERLYALGGTSYVAIAHQLGIAKSSYHNWRAAGITPASAPAPQEEIAPPRPVYNAAARMAKVAAVEQRLAAGQTQEAACRAEGIQAKTFRHWRQQRDGRPRARASSALPLRQVAITALVPAFAAPAEPVSPTPLPPSLSLVVPGGYRLEGLDVESAARLLRALAC